MDFFIAFKKKIFFGRKKFPCFFKKRIEHYQYAQSKETVCKNVLKKRRGKKKHVLII